jgi:hypothetical protein
MDSRNNGERKEYDTYLVTDEELLYRLANCSLLDKLCRVAPNRYVEGARVWFFDKDPGVWNIIKQYKAEKRAAERKGDN